MGRRDVVDWEVIRHPLQEQVVDTFVPNDVAIVGGMGVGVLPKLPEDEIEDDEEMRTATSIMICTGANACGKVRKVFTCAMPPSLVVAECLLEAGEIF
jgi:DNA mismatch repair ATPase MutS